MEEEEPIAAEGKEGAQDLRLAALGARMRAAAKAAGLDSGTIGAALGVGSSTVRHWWKGRYVVPVDKFFAYCEVVGVSVASLAGEPYPLLPAVLLPPGEPVTESGWRQMVEFECYLVYRWYHVARVLGALSTPRPPEPPPAPTPAPTPRTPEPLTGNGGERRRRGRPKGSVLKT